MACNARSISGTSRLNSGRSAKLICSKSPAGPDDLQFVFVTRGERDIDGYEIADEQIRLATGNAVERGAQIRRDDKRGIRRQIAKPPASRQTRRHDDTPRRRVRDTLHHRFTRPSDDHERIIRHRPGRDSTCQTRRLTLGGSQHVDLAASEGVRYIGPIRIHTPVEIDIERLR
jgi:hypothetical protein